MTSSSQSALSYEELAMLVVQLRSELAQTREELRAARERSTEPETQLARTSRTFLFECLESPGCSVIA